MLLEYAVDPEFAADFNNLKLISALFDFGNPRRISAFPQKWQRKVIKAADSASQMNKARVVEKLKQMAEQKACLQDFHRSYDYDHNQSWQFNVTLAHDDHKFQAILSDADGDGFVSSVELDDGHELIKVSMPNVMIKTLPNLMAALHPLLTMAKQIHIVDPYFDPYQQQCRDLFDEIFRVLYRRLDADQIELRICTSAGRGRSPYSMGDEQRFMGNMKQMFTLGPLADHLSVHLVQYDNDMHARYFLTDIAGLILDNSLSIHDNQRINISMMGKEATDRARADFFGDEGLAE